MISQGVFETSSATEAPPGSPPPPTRVKAAQGDRNQNQMKEAPLPYVVDGSDHPDLLEQRAAEGGRAGRWGRG